jgi:hypothetical protein
MDVDPVGSAAAAPVALDNSLITTTPAAGNDRRCTKCCKGRSNARRLWKIKESLAPSELVSWPSHCRTRGWTGCLCGECHDFFKVQPGFDIAPDLGAWLTQVSERVGE